MSDFDISLYNDDFFFWHDKYAREYSIKTMDWFVDKYLPKSVVDFGCGIGSYLESAYNKGIKNLKGFDIGGEYAQAYTPNFLHEFIEYKDCTLPISCGTYDCVISFETAEHIEPIGTDVFVKNIANSCKLLTGLILFTAAPPEQDGCGHINCHYKDFWLTKFAQHKCFEDKNLTDEISTNWKSLNVGCPDYIINNLIVLKKNG